MCWSGSPLADPSPVAGPPACGVPVPPVVGTAGMFRGPDDDVRSSGAYLVVTPRAPVRLRRRRSGDRPYDVVLAAPLLGALDRRQRRPGCRRPPHRAAGAHLVE